MGMTNIELEVARTAIRKNKAVAKKLEGIDWEQRRYEIAMNYLPMAHEIVIRTLKIKCPDMIPERWDGMTVAQATAEQAVVFADELIKELKK